MAKVQSYAWACDVLLCANVYTSSDPDLRHMDVPPDWAEISITALPESNPADLPDCTCKCHDEDEDDEGDNIAGHEVYDCEVCPEDQDWVMHMTLCPLHLKKFSLDYGIPRRAI